MKRKEQPRFSVGDTVVINSTIATRSANAVAYVTQIRSSLHSHTLDKYTVQFEDGSEAQFWDIQLVGCDISEAGVSQNQSTLPASQ